jgi:hypothetical protein
MHLCKFGFMSGYDVWMHHGETIHQRTASVAEDEDDRMDEMLDAIRPEHETNREDPHTPEVQQFFNMLRALEESLHEHTMVSVLAFVICIRSIKSKIVFSNKCYKELLCLFSDVFPSNHKMLKDMYQSKKLLSALGMEYEKIDMCKDNCMIFYKEQLTVRQLDKLCREGIHGGPNFLTWFIEHVNPELSSALSVTCIMFNHLTDLIGYNVC